MQAATTLPFKSASVKTHPELRSCGVYAIKHRRSGRLYVGSTSRPTGIVARLSEHRSRLNRGTHANRRLQMAFAKYGAAAFDFLVIEYCDSAGSKLREQYWLDLLKPDYNVLTNVQDYRPRSEAVRAVMAERASKPYELEYGGQVYAGMNLTSFCADRGLHQGALTQVLLGKKPQFKGWTLPGRGVPPTPVMHSVTGETVSIPYFGGTQFAKAHDLNVAHFNGMLRGRFSTCKGWILKDQPRRRRKDQSHPDQSQP